MKPYEFDSKNPEHLRERATALEHKGELEVLSPDYVWLPRLVQGEPLERGLRYRPAPEPEIIPYTLDTFPADLLRVKRKGKRELLTIGHVFEKRVFVPGTGLYTFHDFLEHFTKCDGSPCGVKKV